MTVHSGWEYEMEFRRYDGDREAVRPLFREADDSEQAINGYLTRGDILVAVEATGIVGYGQLIIGTRTAELKNMAVLEQRRGAGIGRALVHAILQRRERFYQRRGFRLWRVERDASGPESGYPVGLFLDGIPLRDRVWLDQDL